MRGQFPDICVFPTVFFLYDLWVCVTELSAPSSGVAYQVPEHRTESRRSLCPFPARNDPYTGEVVSSAALLSPDVFPRRVVTFNAVGMACQLTRRVPTGRSTIRAGLSALGQCIPVFRPSIVALFGEKHTFCVIGRYMLTLGWFR